MGNSKEYSKKYYLEHKKEAKNYNKKYKKTINYQNYLTNYMKKYNKKYREKNKEKIKKYQKRWRIKNKQRIREYERIRKTKDLPFKLMHILRNRIYMALKNNSKKSSTIELLDCTIQELRNYLQKQFKKGMTWNNWGIKGWHIDHIKPCYQFDLTKAEEQCKCFHYTNLQPLWAKENLEKRRK